MSHFFSPSALMLLSLLSILSALQGCATPAEKFNLTATELGFTSQELDGMPYRHRLFLNPQARDANHIAELHVYLDGDGTPWQSGTRIADDPTPRNPLILEMMKIDRAPAILLGRPCYYGLSRSNACNESLWTSHRYSSEVVTSMQAALERWVSARKIKRLSLIGFSGGGALATLLAPRLERVATVITIAGNLDVRAWSQHHRYLEPTGSLNPMLDAHIPEQVRQIHMAGLKDRNVPARIIESFSASQRSALYLPYAEYDHACCWLDIWPEILKQHLPPQDH